MSRRFVFPAHFLDPMGLWARACTCRRMYFVRRAYRGAA